jgi:hypothetical protein
MKRVVSFALAAVLLSATSALAVDSLPTGSAPNEGKTPGVQPADKNVAPSSGGTTADPKAGKSIDSDPAPDAATAPPKSEGN